MGKRADSGWHRKRPTAATAARAREYRTPQYKATRQQAKRLVDEGHGYCWRCGRWLDPRMEWHLGHDDWDRTVIRGPECVPCNLKAAARKGARVVNAKRSASHTASARRRWVL